VPPTALHELADNPDVSASFVAGGPSFTAPGAAPNRDTLQFGTSYRWNSTQGSFIMVGYDAEIRDRSLVSQVTARAGWAF
jgi:subtilase-type serine protease